MDRIDWLGSLRRNSRMMATRRTRNLGASIFSTVESLEERSLLSGIALTAVPDTEVAGESEGCSPVDLSVDDIGEDGLPSLFAYDEVMYKDGQTDEPVDGTDETTDGIQVMYYSMAGGLGGGIKSAASDSSYFTADEFQQHLLDMVQERWGSLFGQTVQQYDYPWLAYDALPSGIALRSSSSSAHSDTNTQVAGVDEADFVETDGDYIYITQGSQLTIVDAHDPSQLSVVSQTWLSGNVVGEFLIGDRLTVITQSGSGWYGGPQVRFAAGAMPIWGGGNWNPQATVTVFDVSDRAAPSMLQETTLDGTVREARAVGDNVYVVLESNINLPEPLYTEITVADSSGSGNKFRPIMFAEVDPTAEVDPSVAGDGGPVFDPSLVDISSDWGPTTTTYRTYESFDEYIARVGDQLTGLSLPHAFTLTGDGEVTADGPITDPEGIRKPTDPSQQSVLTVASFNVNGNAGIADSVSLMTSPGGTVYMSETSLYVTSVEYGGDGFGWSAQTRIDQFSIDGADVEWQASGTVAGTLLNQYSLDESNGLLRVATHVNTGHWEPTEDGYGNWVTTNDNSLYVLEASGGALSVIGSVEGIAPGEQLTAARFIGDHAYLVTFYQTDPLFTVDLSDPSNPTVTGQLEIPGFSNYLQPVGDGELIGLGQERIEGTWFSQFQVSLFNVTDGSAPQQVDREHIGGDSGWSWSSGQFDPHAVLFSSVDGLLVLPFFNSGTDVDGNYFYDQSIAILRVDADGISVLAEIATKEPALRSVRVGDVLYVVTATTVTAYDLNTLSALGGVDWINDIVMEDVPPIFMNFGAAGGGELQRGNDSSGVPTVALPTAFNTLTVPASTSLPNVVPAATLQTQSYLTERLLSNSVSVRSLDDESSRPTNDPSLAELNTESDKSNEEATQSDRQNQANEKQAVDQFWEAVSESLSGTDGQPVPVEDMLPMADKDKTEQATETNATEKKATSSTDATKRMEVRRDDRSRSTEVAQAAAASRRRATKSQTPKDVASKSATDKAQSTEQKSRPAPQTVAQR